MEKQSYAFQILCNLTYALEHSLSSLDFTISDNIQISFKSKENNVPLKESNWFNIISKGYETKEQALDIGKQVLQTFKLMAVKKRKRILIGDENRGQISSGFLEFLKDQAKKEFDVDADFINISRSGVNVYPLHKEVEFIEGGQGGNTLSTCHVDDIKNELIQLFPYSKASINEKEQLAIDLYLSSQHEKSTEAQFLFLINTVECLAAGKERKMQEKEIVDYISILLKETEEKFPDNESLIGRMSDLKYLSVRQNCKEIITKFLAEQDWEVFDHCYGIRSKLVHKGKVSPPNTPNQYISNLKDIVSRLLMKIVESKS